MKLDEAIEIKSKYQYILQDASIPELIKADNLSIEALNWIKQNRVDMAGHVIRQLPGEDPE